MVEEWRDVIGWGDYYQVSNLGRVKSLERPVSYYRNGNLVQAIKPERMLKPTADKDGYMRVILFADGKKVGRGIHRLVAESFIKNINGNEFVNHKDGVKNNNNVSNLEWVTAKENTMHALKSKLRSVKVTNEVRSKIMYMRDDGFTYAQISRYFKLNSGYVWRVVNEPVAEWRLV